MTKGDRHARRDTADRLAIRALIENWVIWRDARMWDRFRTVWHKDGQMWATWFQGSYEEFIKVSQEGYDRGVRIMHMLGGMSIDIKGKRAIAQTKMTISQRAEVEGVDVRRGLHRALLRFPGKAQRQMGHRAAPACL